MTPSLDTKALDQLFLKARTHSAWRAEPVSDELLQQLVDTMKMGPTSANCSPARLIFVRSDAAKKRLAPLLDATNRAKTLAAPVTVVIGHDLAFYVHLAKLFPHTNARAWFEGNDKKIIETAFRNGSLQGAYLIMAARALGLDCGPMSGFDNAGIDREFFSGTSTKSNFLCNLGYGDMTQLMPRSPRFSFDEMARIV